MASVHVGFSIHDDPGWVEKTRTFVWTGIGWTPVRIAARLGWFAVALGLTGVASAFFDRFDTDSRAGRTSRPMRAASPPRSAEPLAAGPANVASAREAPSPKAAGLSPLSAPVGPPRLLGIAAAELRVALKGTTRWWYIVAAGLAVAGALVPAGTARAILLAIAWIWPLPVFSAMGCRERRFGVDEILAAAPHPLRAQLPGVWLAGVAVALLAGAGVALRLALTGDLLALGAWLAGALFVPSLALALGVVSGTPRLFEAVYLLLWYAGPMNQIPILDYGGFTADGRARGVPFVFLAIAGVCLAVSLLGRLLRARA